MPAALGGSRRTLAQVAVRAATAPAPTSARLPPVRISQRTTNPSARDTTGRVSPITPVAGIKLRPLADRLPLAMAMPFGARTKLRRESVERRASVAKQPEAPP